MADHGFPYDLMSVMHYRQFAFSKNRKPTILPKRSVPYLRCRGSDCPSEMDIKKINFLYKCGDKRDEYDEERDGDDFENEVTVDDVGNKYRGEDEEDDGSIECDHGDIRCRKRVRALRAKSNTNLMFPDYGYSFGEEDDEDDAHRRQHASRSALRGRLLHRLMLARHRDSFFDSDSAYHHPVPTQHRIHHNIVSPLFDLLKRK